MRFGSLLLFYMEQRVRQNEKKSAFVIMTLLLIASVLIAIRVGSVSVTLEDIVKAFTTGAKGTPGIVRDIRIPRVLMAVYGRC